MNRLLVIGLDGYEPELANRLIQQGRLPNLEKLVQRSAWVHLDHGAARRTGLAWEHFATGLSPQAASRWSAVNLAPDSYQCSQAPTNIKPFLHNLGVDSVVFDPPYFDLGSAPGLRGMVNWGAHDPGTAQFSRPAGLADEIKDLFGDYAATPWIYGFTWPSASRTREMGQALVAATEQRARIAHWLLTERMPEWQLGMVVVSELHSAVEALWHGVDEVHPLHGIASAAHAREGLENTYEAVDRLVAKLVSARSDTAVLAFSMHGMGPNESDVASMALLPEFMYRLQFDKALLKVPPGQGASVPLLGEDESWSGCVKKYFSHQPITALADRVARHTNRLIDRIAQTSQTNTMDWMPASWYSRYWSRMGAFALPSFYDGQIRINLSGREANGRVSLEEYPEYCRRIEQLLRECVDTVTGRSVVREIVRPEISDPAKLGPSQADLIVVWQDSPLGFKHPGLGTIGPLPYRRPGGHTGGYGAAYLDAPGLTPGFYGTRSAFDVAPTIANFVAPGTKLAISGEDFLPSMRAKQVSNQA